MRYRVPSKQKNCTKQIDDTKRFKKEEWGRPAELDN